MTIMLAHPLPQIIGWVALIVYLALLIIAVLWLIGIRLTRTPGPRIAKPRRKS